MVESKILTAMAKKGKGGEGNSSIATCVDSGKSVTGGKTGMNRIKIDVRRIVTWALIFTNTFFVSYFFAKLFQLV